VTRYVLDTNLYVRAFRNVADAEALQRFYDANVRGLYLSSVVLHELMFGASSPRKSEELLREVARPFRRTGRTVTPSHDAWIKAGNLLAEFAWNEGLERGTVPRSLVNDVLLAASCREQGLTLVTENERDFRRIQKRMKFEYVLPWPA
jgi:tRNA(fMet)-specific endonuclease VapC